MLCIIELINYSTKPLKTEYLTSNLDKNACFYEPCAILDSNGASPVAYDFELELEVEFESDAEFGLKLDSTGDHFRKSFNLVSNSNEW